MMGVTISYGRARCPKCDTWYDIDEGHTCPSAEHAAALLPPAVVDAAAVPEDDRPHPVGLTWGAPTPAPSPIRLGPSEDHPDVHLGLDLDAARFFRAARHGLHVGRARIDVEEAALWFAYAPNMRTATDRLAYLAHTTGVLSERVTDYANELAA